ncbi:MAG TPA: amidase [Acidobacteriota bacterium]|nr:amidase [Acidobacteriota bacterium]
MPHLPEYAEYDAQDLAALVRRNDVTPRELLAEAVARLERINPRLNAVVTPLYDFAEKEIERGLPDGFFSGVPFLLKDLVEELAGAPMQMGSRACRGYIPSRDSEMVARFRRSGVVIFGKTNTPEFGLTITTESELYGPCRNPWNLEHTTGGSSGGSAAAVAAGVVPVAAGNDGGGSIRIPASCCGVFGFKPSRARNPTGPSAAELWQGAAVSHVLTRTVRDSAAFLDVTAGPEPGSPYEIRPPERPFLEEVGCPPGRLRIAFTRKSPFGPLHPEVLQAVDDTVSLLSELGHEVDEVFPPIDLERLVRSFLVLVGAEVAADLDLIGYVRRQKVRSTEVEATTWALRMLGQSLRAADLAKARRDFGFVTRSMGRFHLEHDVLMTPTLAVPPWRLGELTPNTAELLLLRSIAILHATVFLKLPATTRRMVSEVFSRSPFTALANITGQPAMSVPLHWTEQGLPVGIQFIAPLGEEARLFRLAAQLEQARPWFGRRPPLAEGR